MPKYRLLALMFCFAYCGALPARAQQVYVGVADQWDDLLKKPEQWKFVRENADGFYVNFIEMNGIKGEVKQPDGGKLALTASLFTHKNAILESDHKDATAQDDQHYLTQLHAAGFTVPVTSLNYGWSSERADNLKKFHLLPGQAPRLNLVQMGPWVIHGDVNGASPDNDAYRANLAKADGTSTDGPMGFWLSNQGNMREGSFSMVKYAHAHGQKALVMLCPFGVNNKLYTPAQALAVSQECVREHEDAGAIPDIWAVFEYATDISAVPEQIDGAPISSTTGMAYWLIHHLKDPDGAATLNLAAQDSLKTSTRPATAAEANDRVKEVSRAEMKVAGSTTIAYLLRNSNPWLDLCPVLRAQSNNPGWKVSATLNGVDVTDALFKGGVDCVGDFRLWHRTNPPQGDHQLKITATPQKPANGELKPLDISLMLSPHPSYRERVEQRLELHLTVKP